MNMAARQMGWTSDFHLRNLPKCLGGKIVQGAADMEWPHYIVSLAPFGQKNRTVLYAFPMMPQGMNESNEVPVTFDAAVARELGLAIPTVINFSDAWSKLLDEVFDTHAIKSVMASVGMRFARPRHETKRSGAKRRSKFLRLSYEEIAALSAVIAERHAEAHRLAWQQVIDGTGEEGGFDGLHDLIEQGETE